MCKLLLAIFTVGSKGRWFLFQRHATPSPSPPPSGPHTHTSPVGNDNTLFFFLIWLLLRARGGHRWNCRAKSFVEQLERASSSVLLDAVGQTRKHWGGKAHSACQNSIWLWFTMLRHISEEMLTSIFFLSRPLSGITSNQSLSEDSLYGGFSQKDA